MRPVLLSVSPQTDHSNVHHVRLQTSWALGRGVGTRRKPKRQLHMCPILIIVWAGRAGLITHEKGEQAVGPEAFGPLPYSGEVQALCNEGRVNPQGNLYIQRAEC